MISIGLLWMSAGSNDLKIKNAMCLIIAGIVYPFISNFWAEKIKFIKLIPADEY